MFEYLIRSDMMANEIFGKVNGKNKEAFGEIG